MKTINTTDLPTDHRAALAWWSTDPDDVRAVTLGQLADEIDNLRRVLALASVALTTDPAITDTIWRPGHDVNVSMVDEIAGALGVDTVGPGGEPTEAVRKIAGLL